MIHKKISQQQLVRLAANVMNKQMTLEQAKQILGDDYSEWYSNYYCNAVSASNLKYAGSALYHTAYTQFEKSVMSIMKSLAAFEKLGSQWNKYIDKYNTYDAEKDAAISEAVDTGSHKAVLRAIHCNERASYYKKLADAIVRRQEEYTASMHKELAQAQTCVDEVKKIAENLDTRGREEEREEREGNSIIQLLVELDIL